MKRFLKNIFLYCLLTLLVSTIPYVTMAQGSPGDPGDPACDPQCNCRPDGTWCPIDNGLYLLLLTGIGYGIKKLSDSRKASASMNS